MSVPHAGGDWNALLERLRELGAEGPLAVALSGGLDSRFLVHAMRKAGVEMLALHAAGVHMPRRESAYAQDWAARESVPLRVVAVDVLGLDGVGNNSRDRCYYCKKYVLELLGKSAPGHILCDGTNADDLHAHRPGLRALIEAGVRSPLAEAGLSKARLRMLGVATGLEAPEQTARPCLLTRFPYDSVLEKAMLQRVEAAETALEAAGLQDFRLRICPEPLLQTVPLDAEARVRATMTLASMGFYNVKLREEARVGGFFDRENT